MKRTFFRRPRVKRRIKNDIQTISLCGLLTDNTIPNGGATCFDPLVAAVALCHGGNELVAANAPPGAPGLSTEAGRGAVVSGLHFEYGGFTTCWLSNLTTLGSHIIKHYCAIVKAEFDTFTYVNGGGVVPTWARVPNIIESDLAVSVPGAGEQRVFQREEDIMWRSLDFSIARNCHNCFPQSDEACGMVGPVFTQSSLTNDSTAYQAMMTSYPTKKVRLKNRRFLRPNEALFFVENWVTTIPAGAQFIWETDLYGVAAIRVKR